MRFTAKPKFQNRKQQKKNRRKAKRRSSNMVTEKNRADLIDKSVVSCHGIHKDVQVSGTSLTQTYDDIVSPYPESITESTNDYNMLSHPVLEKINELLILEKSYQPDIDILLNNEEGDKVTACLRDAAVLNLRFLHVGIYHLSPFVFPLAVNMIDRFLVRVKVKPKYLTCVVMACYALAAQLLEQQESQPSLQSLVDTSRCGGSVADLKRMMQIVRSKLTADRAPTALDFLHLFLHGDAATPGDPLPSDLVAHMEIALCHSTSVYKHSPSSWALALLLADLHASSSTISAHVTPDLLNRIGEVCGVPGDALTDCSQMLVVLTNQFYGQPRPSSRDSLVWTISKRTLSSMTSSTRPILPTIFEIADPTSA